ncbi:GYDIA family GHMP kinase [Mariniflexile sp. AS56]|uniref:GYDIA family GHMP kinase n=1 Tax=Mariniflexile sp. AS56 TaxID=3063957 RepID=UPI0026ECACE8|nr:GYDIA family GHMP kinase [Mariniflexile sp. AS56]MDO7171980.1 GYDIA family GHMP kinase [Mariniflexile sp. AS56]
METYYSNGKLLLTGEYVVLDGALSLAVPTKFGQSLKIETLNEQNLVWESFDTNGNCWFNNTFPLEISKMLKQVQHDDEISKRIIQILKAAKTLNPDFLNTKNGFRISTHLTFPRNWGLGTSSTLINNMSQWAHVNPFELLEQTFGGSGYDIACAQNNTPITYQLQKDKIAVNPIIFNPKFKDSIYFVYLNKKQNSRDGIATYQANKQHLEPIINDINILTTHIIECQNLNDFETLLDQHEQIISNITKQATVKSIFFNDFKGSIKSLGAWGGDFVLVTSTADPSSYFKEKGFDTIIPYTDMVL